MRRQSLLLTFAAVVIFFLPTISHATTNKTISTLATGGRSSDVVVVGNYAYLAEGSNGVTVVDISNRLAPTLVRHVFIPDIPTQVEVDGSTLYVAATSQVSVKSLADPTNPTSFSTITPAHSMGSVSHVASNGTALYILAGDNSSEELQKYDVSNKLAPVFVSSTSIISGTQHSAGWLTLSGNYAYITVGHQLFIVDITTMGIVGTYTDTAATLRGIQIFGAKAYINGNGLHVISVADVTAPTKFFDVIDNTIGGSDIAISNGYIFLTQVSGDLVIYDFASTGTPVYSDTFTGASYGAGITIANDVAFVANGSVLQLFDVSQPDTVPPDAKPIGDITPVVIPGGKYTDPGVTTDSGVVTTSGKVDTSKVGRYVLTYDVTDRGGNVTTIKRTVTVGPIVEKLTLKNNTYTLKVGKKSIVLRPFVGYRGAILGRKLTVDSKTNPMYVFVATDAMRKPELVVYNSSGKQIARQNLATISTKGLQVEITPNPATLSVFYAIAPKANGLTATIFNISKSGFKSLKTVTAAKGKATLLMKWVKGYTNEYALVTLIKGKLDRPFVWRYNGSKKSFVHDTKFVVTRLLWTKTSVKLK